MQISSQIFNPFPGLRSFEENEDLLFFGREKQVTELVKKLRQEKFLAVIGSSGSGKSSLVKSGLIPALHSGFMSGAGSSWKICTFRPGNNPIGNLATALSSNNLLYHNIETTEDSFTYTAIIESTLRRSSQGLVEAYKQSRIDKKNNLLILVDQFEEIFRFSRVEKDAKERKRDSIAFINLLLKASEQKEFPIYVVFTMRSDFLGDCTEFRGLPEAINEGQYLVPRMTRDERREAITGPVAVGGATITPQLLNQLLNDVGDNPDQLPILQHALMRTWNIWSSKSNNNTPIDIDAYEEIGTMSNALSQHAEEAYNDLNTDRKKQICESLFKSLTDRGSDTRGIRRPTKLSEICKLANASSNEVIEVIDVFRANGRSFLMPPSEVAINEDTIIDISHESLMRGWNRLLNWVEEENQSAEIYLRLCEAANLYELGKGGLWRDPELQLAWKWKEEAKPNVTWASRYNNYFEKAILFLDYCKQQSELAIQHKEKMHKRRLKRARLIAIFISCIAIAALLLAIFSFDQRNKANQQKIIALNKTEEAEKERKNALAQKHLAVENANEAEKQKQKAEENATEAINQKTEAEKQKQKAEENAIEANKQKKNAEEKTIEAEKQKQKAEENATEANKQKKKAEEKTIEAEKQRKAAEEQRKISTKLKDLAEAKNLANLSLQKFREGNKTESKKLAINAFLLNKENDGPKQNAEIYTALNTNWADAIKNKNQATYHKYAVKNIIGKSNNNIVFTADEAGFIYTAKEENGILQTIGKPILLKEDIRALAVTKDNTKLFVATANGNCFIFNCSSNAQTTLTNNFKINGIAKSIAVINNQTFIIITDKEILKVTTDKASIMQASLQRSGLTSLVVGDKLNKIFVAENNKLFIYNTYNDLVNNQISNTYTLPSKITSLAINENENFIAAGTYDGTLWLKETNSHNNPTTATIHKSSINCIQFKKLKNGVWQIATGSADHTIKLMDVQQLVQHKQTEDIITLSDGGHTKWVYGIWYSNNGEHLYSCSEDKKIIGWKTTMDGLYKALQ
ncbi:MAG: hypothetical protein IT251_09710 [Chitinophagaceae bacterium]|nr:hypothetical protein [Chitinophagaceae bacterium]